MFLDNYNLASYADEKTPYPIKENILRVIKEIEDKMARVFSWFSANYFKANQKKSHFLLTSNEQVNLSLDDLIIKNSKYKYLQFPHI